MTDLMPNRITTRTGLELDCVEQGERTGTPVILLHGYTDSWRSYGPLMHHLPDYFHAVALSQRGHGDSAKPAGPYRLAILAEDVADAMEALGIPRAVIVGHSMGSLVATRFALDHAARALGLVLIGAFATLKGNEGGEALWQQAVAELTDPVDPGLARMFQESTLARPVPPAFLETVVAESLKAPAHVWRGALRMLLDEDFSDELGRVAAPTLIVWGERDEFCSAAEAEALKAAIPGARLEAHPGTGHAPHWEDPERVGRQIAEFVDGITDASASERARKRHAASGRDA